MTSSEVPPNSQSAVDFATRMRAHVGLPVRDLEASIRYYEALLGQRPSKVRPGYAKFEVAEPPLNLALNQSDTPDGQHPSRHYGIQVKSVAEVQAAHGTLRAAGFATLDERGATCCFAVQDKVWSVDPDGNRWEVFVVLDDDAKRRMAPGTSEGDRSLQPPACCQ